VRPTEDGPSRTFSFLSLRRMKAVNSFCLRVAIVEGGPGYSISNKNCWILDSGLLY
jgi:hypothetical protein